MGRSLLLRALGGRRRRARGSDGGIPWTLLCAARNARAALSAAASSYAGGWDSRPGLASSAFSFIRSLVCLSVSSL